ncbi:hypothetical protein BH10PSE14_BH10PSE14_35250 [soil metagenome]
MISTIIPSPPHAAVADVPPAPVVVRPAPRSASLYLVGEQDRSAAKPVTPVASRTLVCINGKWHALRGKLATFEQIIALAFSPDEVWRARGATVAFRRGAPDQAPGSLTPGDVVPIAEGMLINVNATILS